MSDATPTVDPAPAAPVAPIDDTAAKLAALIAEMADLKKQLASVMVVRPFAK